MKTETKLSIAILFFGLLLITLYWFLPYEQKTAKSQYDMSKEKILLPKYNRSIYREIPEVKEYIEDLSVLFKSGKSILKLNANELDKHGIEAQKIVLENKEFTKDSKQGEKLLHNDMMRILPVIVSSLSKAEQEKCKNSICYQAEKYNFVTNTTTVAIVDVNEKQVLSVKRYSDMQPDISLRLKYIAQAIALNAPEVKEQLGTKPSKKDMSMANVRGNLKDSPCENAKHLCVAPTFSDHKNKKALWAIVDLTDLKLAAAKWAGLGKTTTPACISERTLQNRRIMETYCRHNTRLKKNNWDIQYRLTGSDGLEVIDVSYKGKPVLKSAKIVDWHVSYQEKGAETLDTSSPTFVEGRLVEYNIGENGEYLFGYNDAMGCPMFSTSVVLPFNAPQVKALPSKNGFMLTQDYRNPKWPMACNYRYENRFEFYDDGSFRVVGVNKGRGCGENAIYRPVMRIDMAIAEEENFYSYVKEDDWKEWMVEGHEKVKNNIKHAYKIVSAKDETKGYYIEPNYGQYGDKSRGDNANIYLTEYKEDEGSKDLLTLGSCCNLDDDGVNRYIENNVSALHKDLIVWYVPRIRNDAREGSEYCWADTVVGTSGNLEVKVWPCSVGPKFIPMDQ